MYQFCNHHKSYKTVVRETFLPLEGYKETHMSSQTINKWFSYFRYLCIQDGNENLTKIGGEGDVVEMDESMCGKCKYGLGDSRKRRQRWIFGGVSRRTGRAFMSLCPENKRTRKALWPIVQAWVEPGTTLHTDGWRAYRRLPELGYLHRWVDHSKNYVSPQDRTLHTNRIEGLWGVFKAWLPHAGKYNLQQYMFLFLWFEDCKFRKIDPFWALVKLVKDDNNVETLNAAAEKEEKEADTEGAAYNPQQDKEEQEEAEKEEEADSDEEFSDEEDQEVFYFLDCVGCKKIFRKKELLMAHVRKCDKL